MAPLFRTCKTGRGKSNYPYHPNPSLPYLTGTPLKTELHIVTFSSYAFHDF